MKSIANTSLNLGLVSVPIQVFKATSSKDVSFSLCGPEGEAVEQVYRVTGTDRIIGTRNDCSRSYDGFKLDDDAITAIADAAKMEDGKDLKALNISAFIPLSKVPFNRVTGWYFIGSNPKGGNISGFATIVKAMEKKKMAAVVKWVPRTRQEMMVLYVQKGILYGVSVSFAADVQEAAEPVTSHTDIKPDKALLDVAEQLIDTYVDKDAAVLDEMADSSVEKKLSLIEAARAGTPIEANAPEPAPTGDLFAALQASLDNAKAKVGA